MKKVQDEFDFVMDEKSVTTIDFDKTVRNMGRLNPKIKLMVKLQKAYKQIHEKYSVYADTEQSLEIPDAERRQMKHIKLQQMNLNGLNQKDDLYVYTTKHYFYGL